MTVDDQVLTNKTEDDDGINKATHVLKPSGRESEEYRIVTVVKPFEPPSKNFVLRVGDVVEILGSSPVKSSDGSLV